MDLLYDVVHNGVSQILIHGRNVSSFSFNGCSNDTLYSKTPPPWPADGGLYCNGTWDTVSCWPVTPADHLALLPCPVEFNGMYIQTEGNASRLCLADGTWQTRSDYSSCAPRSYIENEEKVQLNSVLMIIYYAGFSLSIVALLVSLFIFSYFKSLQCLRNRIHCHLMVTFLARYVHWIILNTTLPTLDQAADFTHPHYWLCRLIVLVHRYIQLTNFHWMLVEGLYLHTVIVWAFSVDRVIFWHYGLLGWGLPAVLTFIWVTLKAKLDNNSCWLPAEIPSPVEYSYIVPILIVLLVNVIFMCSIIWVLVTKLRASNTLQTRLYRKAVRATTILLPLLGLTYVLMITSPGDDVTSVRVYGYVNAILQSTQGLFVAVCYCFMNGEVRSAVLQRVNIWQEERSIATRYSRATSFAGVSSAPIPAHIAIDSAHFDRDALHGHKNGDHNNGHSNGRLFLLHNNQDKPAQNLMSIPMLSLNDEAI